MNRYTEPREILPGREDEHLRELGVAVRGLMKGKSNNGFVVTLAADADETEVDVEWATSNAIVFLFPQTASAAAEQGVWASTSNGAVLVHHSSSSETDRTFAMLVIG